MTDVDRETRNAVFSNVSGIPKNIDPRMPMQSALDMVRTEFGLDIPAENVPLASKGKVYQEEWLRDKEIIEIRAMTAREEDILTSASYLKKGTVITELIKSCLIDKRIDASTLLTGDRNALMIAIRITGYGADYDAELECSECGAKYENTFDLAQLPLNFLEIEPVEQGMNLFSFELPYTKKTVQFRFLTGKDEEEIVAANAKMKKHGIISDTTVTTNLIYSIQSIAGITDKSKISQFIKHMPARDSLALRSYIRDNEPGIDMKQEATCKMCGAVEEVSMPLGMSFLWPSAAKR